MHSFDTNQEAKEFVSANVDVQTMDHVRQLGDGMMLHAFSQELEEGIFTNVYDLSFPAQNIHPSIESHGALTSVVEFVDADPTVRAATGGGFFFLADQAVVPPRQLGLNLVLSAGQLHGLPVADQEAVLVTEDRLSAERVQALGELTVSNTELSWSGSLTDHETDVKVFANGNSIINHVQNDETGSIRILEEGSRYTPKIDADDQVDVGLIRGMTGHLLALA